jgi:hypothetical protein
MSTGDEEPHGGEESWSRFLARFPLTGWEDVVLERDRSLPCAGGALPHPIDSGAAYAGGMEPPAEAHERTLNRSGRHSIERRFSPLFGQYAANRPVLPAVTGLCGPAKCS